MKIEAFRNFLCGVPWGAVRLHDISQKSPRDARGTRIRICGSLAVVAEVCTPVVGSQGYRGKRCLAFPSANVALR